MGLFSRRRADSAPAATATAPEVQPDAPALPAITDESFMTDTEGGWTLVDFWAGWCAPCRTFAPTFRQAARLHGDRIRFATLDVEAAPRAAALVGVRSIPTVVAFGPDGSEVTRASGVLAPAQLEALVAELDRLAARA